MLLDIMDNLPRLRLSSAHFQLILWLLKECGVTHVPSYSAFRKTQESLSTLCGSEPKHFKSLFNNHFYVNDPSAAIKRNFANPHVAPHMNFYPEVTPGPISEVWQCERWKEFDPSQHTPMFSTGGKQFYIEEVAKLRDNRLVIPISWMKRGDEICADANLVSIDKDGLWFRENGVIIVPSSLFERNCKEIISSLPGEHIPWKGEIWNNIPTMPNPDRQLVPDGYDLYDVYLATWFDDVSGNKSKQYNKHFVGYTANTNLPGQLLQQEFFVEYLSNSQHATALEQLSAIKELVNASQSNPIICYNASTGRMCGVRLHISVLPADNPQQAEEASHMGGNANYPCRKCNVGGPSEHVQSDEGYHSLYLAIDDISRSATETRTRLINQMKIATKGVQKSVSDMQTATGTKDKITEYWIEILLQKAKEEKKKDPSKSVQEVTDTLERWLEEQPGDKMNPLLDIAGLDPTKDTPVEILHTILLGIVKYVWHMFNTSLTDAERNLFVIRLQSTDLDGLNVPPLRAAYMMQYRSNLIGKHFKTLMQTMVFHAQDLVTPALFELIKAVGELGAVLWVSEIPNMDDYLSDLEILIGNTLDAFAAVDPLKIIQKIKIHLLPHVVSDIRRFGPAVRNSTEIFECYNAIFRLCSVFSNHQAPSRDIARKFSSMARVKHILSGGYWLYGDKWIQASPRVRRILEADTTIQRHLGWVPPNLIKYGILFCKSNSSGYMKPLALRKTVPRLWSTTKASTVLFNNFLYWNDNQSVISASGDVCKIGSWVVVRPNADSNQFAIGQIVELLSPSPDGTGPSTIPENLVTIESFILGDKRHTIFDMPVLHQPEGQKFLVITTRAVLFRISVQHDCALGKCKPTGLRTVVQERIATENHTNFLVHNNRSHFVINTHALHNANLLRQVLPRDLTKPQPQHGNAEQRKAWHAEIAITVRQKMADKRKTTNEKRRATIAA
ncbi:hypothetical protein K435DRAFT_721412, partial [Dendrothele bispora CBS 962.96]